jgi:hypothetical protein
VLVLARLLGCSLFILPMGLALLMLVSVLG